MTRSCDLCAIRKVRCSQNTNPDTGTCSNCAKNSLDCVVTNTSSRQKNYIKTLESRIRELEHAINNQKAPDAPSENMTKLNQFGDVNNSLMEKQACPVYLHLIDFFFDQLHPSFPVFHRANFISKLVPFNLNSPVLLFSIYAFASRLILSRRSYSLKYNVKLEELNEYETNARCLLLQNMANPTFEYTQALYLFVLYLLSAGKIPETYIWCGKLIRTTMLFNLNIEDRAKQIMDVFEVDTRRRLYWSIFIHDRAMSIIGGRQYALSTQFSQTPFPIPEWCWQTFSMEKLVLQTNTRVTLKNWHKIASALQPGSVNVLAGFPTIVVLISISSSFSKIGLSLKVMELDYEQGHDRDIDGSELLILYHEWQRHHSHLTLIQKTLEPIDGILERYQLTLSSELQGFESYSLITATYNFQAQILSNIRNVYGLQFPLEVFPWISDDSQRQVTRQEKLTTRHFPPDSPWLKAALKLSDITCLASRHIIQHELFGSPYLTIAFLAGAVVLTDCFLAVELYSDSQRVLFLEKVRTILLFVKVNSWLCGEYQVRRFEKFFADRGLPNCLPPEEVLSSDPTLSSSSISPNTLPVQTMALLQNENKSSLQQRSATSLNDEELAIFCQKFGIENINS